jgi:hypothetical protein
MRGSGPSEGLVVACVCVDMLGAGAFDLFIPMHSIVSLSHCAFTLTGYGSSTSPWVVCLDWCFRSAAILDRLIDCRCHGMRGSGLSEGLVVACVCVDMLGAGAFNLFIPMHTIVTFSHCAFTLKCYEIFSISLLPALSSFRCCLAGLRSQVWRTHALPRRCTRVCKPHRGATGTPAERHA